MSARSLAETERALAGLANASAAFSPNGATPLACDTFRYLKVSLAAVLAIVGLKMLFAEPLKAAVGPAFNLYLLLVVLVVLVCGVLASIVNTEPYLRASRHDGTSAPRTGASETR